MPVYLEDINEFPELEKFESVLIVPCRFCPAASLAVTKDEPYFEFFRKFLKTDAYEKYIATVKSKLERKGVKTDIFKSKLLHQFVICMWTSRRRRKLLKRASKYEALIVLGCEAAVQTVSDAVAAAPCKVYQGMRSEGIMSIKPEFHLPGNISLELNSVIPLLHQAKGSEPWVSL